MANVAYPGRGFLIAAILGLGLGLGWPGSPWAADAAAAVVRIEAAPGGQARSGSGFVVRIEGESAYVATAAHVVEGEPAPRLYFRDYPQRAHAARVVRLEGANPEGLAVLLLESGLPAGIQALAMAPGGGDDLEAGDSVTALGVPAGLRTWAAIQGTVVAWKDRAILFSGGVDEGNSGGPLLKGAGVVGLVMANEGNFGLAVPATALKRFLKSNGIAWGTEPQASPPTIQPQPAAPPKVGETFRDCPDCPEMVVIPAGGFQMGSPDTEPGRSDDEGPVHTVTFERPFAIGKYEVTFDQWNACVKAGGCTHDPNEAGNLPVGDVNWNDAQDYMTWLSKQTGQTYRLPSEAEWEYAARAKTTTPWFWGDDPANACRYANVFDQTGKREARYPYAPLPCDDHHAKLAPIGSFEANAFDLKDMLGNVQEWTQDCWHDSYQGAPSDGSAWTRGSCAVRVGRGGAWLDTANTLRAAFRFRNSPLYRSYSIGFRPARTL
ncbi:SUMF1/EgtB/PvdO family nonheme iron enzyme [uncultured Thiodictyon sp.]|uniref:SUMF1/EgtB/PvdO family nonheme iron enzyme n=1 Tax=uncultured Thiodictyon sp. TaxID=1846217 RepID=UPI0025D52828|nr:SUMF1/EgtB/PvdO family nonheme iron enzyme [uncultured Thiodictyon sp.]